MKFRSFCYLTALVASLALTACGSPYLEKGFKTEADYDFAASANLSPVGVDRFKSVGISNPTQYKSAITEMQLTSYSKSNNVDDVLQFAQDRFEGAKVGVSAMKFRDTRLAEVARLKAEKLEADRLAAKRKAEQEAAEKAAAAEKAKADAEKAKAAAAEKSKRENEATAERLAKLAGLGASAPTMLEVIVDFATFKGKNIVLICDNLVGFGKSGGTCESGNQSLSIETEGINKDFFTALLKSCPNYYAKENRSSCSGVEILGLVDGFSVPRLKNVTPYTSCREGYVWVKSSNICYEPTESEVRFSKSLEQLMMLLGK